MNDQTEHLILFAFIFIVGIAFILFYCLMSRKLRGQRKLRNMTRVSDMEAILDDPIVAINGVSVPCDIYEHIINKPVRIPYIIGVAGGSGSGKSFVCGVIENTIKKCFKQRSVTIISLDSYYLGGDTDTNYDIPEAIDWNLLLVHLQELIAGRSVDCPIYDFSKHQRLGTVCRKIDPTDIIILEGILVLTRPDVRSLCDSKFFVNAFISTQIFRRILRDVNERGRTIEEVMNRYERDVAPSYNQYVGPSLQYADIQINNLKGHYVGLEVVINHVITVLNKICSNPERKATY